MKRSYFVESEKVQPAKRLSKSEVLWRKNGHHRSLPEYPYLQEEFAYEADRSSLLTPSARKELARGGIPDVTDFCHELYQSFFKIGAMNSAVQFIPAMQMLAPIKEDDAIRCIQNPVTSHTLVQNKLLKIVLIHWPAGEISSIHGHPENGCVFKVLRGTVEEKRYTTDQSPKLLSVNTYHSGSIAYIDDRIGYHSVGNFSDEPAISIHAYTPGL